MRYLLWLVAALLLLGMGFGAGWGAATSMGTPHAPLDAPSTAPTEEGEMAAMLAALGEKGAAAPSSAYDSPMAKGGELRLEPLVIDFGKVIEGEARTHTYTILRPEGQPLHIGGLLSPCACVHLRMAKRVFKPGEQAELTVEIHSLTIAGKKDYTIRLETLKPERAILKARALIQAKRVPAKLRILPASFQFGRIEQGKIASVLIFNLTTKPLRIEKVACDIDGFEPIQPQHGLIAPGGRASVGLKVVGGLPSGMLQSTCRIHTDTGGCGA